MNRLTAAAFLFLSITFLGCEKREEQPIDYMTCKVNGLNWKAKSNSFWGNRFRTAQIDGNLLLLHGSNEDENTTVELDAGDPSNELVSSTYSLGINSFSVGSFIGYKSNFRYNTDSLHKGVIQFTINKDRTRVDGTFSFTAKSAQSEETVEVTEGKFSIELNP